MAHRVECGLLKFTTEKHDDIYLNSEFKPPAGDVTTHRAFF